MRQTVTATTHTWPHVPRCCGGSTTASICGRYLPVPRPRRPPGGMTARKPGTASRRARQRSLIGRCLRADGIGRAATSRRSSTVSTITCAVSRPPVCSPGRACTFMTGRSPAGDLTPASPLCWPTNSSWSTSMRCCPALGQHRPHTHAGSMRLYERNVSLSSPAIRRPRVAPQAISGMSAHLSERRLRGLRGFSRTRHISTAVVGATVGERRPQRLSVWTERIPCSSLGPTMSSIWHITLGREKKSDAPTCPSPGSSHPFHEG